MPKKHGNFVIFADHSFQSTTWEMEKCRFYSTSSSSSASSRSKMLSPTRGTILSVKEMGKIINRCITRSDTAAWF